MENFNLENLTEGTGLNLIDLITHLPKIKQGVNFAKDKLHLVKEYEGTIKKSEDEIIMYAAFVGSKDIDIRVMKIKNMEINGKKYPVIVESVNKAMLFEQVEKLTENLPGV